MLSKAGGSENIDVWDIITDVFVESVPSGNSNYTIGTINAPWDGKTYTYNIELYFYTNVRRSLWGGANVNLWVVEDGGTRRVIYSGANYSSGDYHVTFTVSCSVSTIINLQTSRSSYYNTQTQTTNKLLPLTKPISISRPKEVKQITNKAIIITFGRYIDNSRIIDKNSFTDSDKIEYCKSKGTSHSLNVSSYTAIGYGYVVYTGGSGSNVAQIIINGNIVAYCNNSYMSGIQFFKPGDSIILSNLTSIKMYDFY